MFKDIDKVLEECGRIEMEFAKGRTCIFDTEKVLFSLYITRSSLIYLFLIHLFFFYKVAKMKFAPSLGN